MTAFSSQLSRYAMLLILSSCLLNTAVASDFNWQQAVKPGETLLLNTDLGSVELKTHDKNEIVVEVSNRGANAELFSVEAEYKANQVIVNGRLSKAAKNNYKQKVKFSITTPKTFDIDLNTRGGSIAVSSLTGGVLVSTAGGSLNFEDITGKVEGKTSGGSIQAERVSGDVELRTSGGSIKLEKMTGKVLAKTSGGSIKIEEVTGPVQAKTSGGSILVDKAGDSVDARTSGGSVKVYFAAQPKDDSILKTSAGSVKVAFAEQVGFDISAATSAGKIYSEFAVNGMNKAKRKMSGPINGGGPKLTLKTSAGSIKIDSL